MTVSALEECIEEDPLDEEDEEEEPLVGRIADVAGASLGLPAADGDEDEGRRNGVAVVVVVDEGIESEVATPSRNTTSA